MNRLPLALLASLAACAAPAPAPIPDPAPTSAPASVPAPPPDTAFPGEPVIGRAVTRNVVFYNHADASWRNDTIAGLLQQQYDFLFALIGDGPRWIIVHAGNDYPCGSTRTDGPWPEMYLQAPSIFDTAANYAHEMTHCFHAQFGRMPHWFEESMADVNYAESEIALWQRRNEKEMLARFDRVDERSYEMAQVRTRFGAPFVRQLYRILQARRAECRQLMQAGTTLEERNLFLLEVVSAAAGQDLTETFTREFGFNPRTRERQRGY